MSILAEIENRLEKLVEGFFNRQFKTSLQPVEVAKRLIKEMDRHRNISVEATYVPNCYIVFLSNADFSNFDSFRSSLVKEFSKYLIAHADQKQYQFPGEVEISFQIDGNLKVGDFKVEASAKAEKKEGLTSGKGTAVISAEEAARLGLTASKPGAVLVEPISGNEYLLNSYRTTIGRQSGNDIILSDKSVSRKHAYIEKQGSAYLLVDLGSTNGTKVNDKPISKVFLNNGDRLSLGRTSLVFSER